MSSDIASLSCGLPLHKMNRHQNLCHLRIFYRCTVFTIRKIPLGICYYDDILLWRSDYGGVDLHFLLLLVSVHMRKQSLTHGITVFFQIHSECSIHWEYTGNIFRKLPRNCQSRINSKVTDSLDQLHVDVWPVISSRMNKYFRILWGY